MKRPRNLIVDDSSVMRKIVERSLRQAGLDLGDIVVAGNGIEALAPVKESAFDLILAMEYVGIVLRQHTAATAIHAGLSEQ